MHIYAVSVIIIDDEPDARRNPRNCARPSASLVASAYDSLRLQKRADIRRTRIILTAGRRSSSLSHEQVTA